MTGRVIADDESDVREMAIGRCGRQQHLRAGRGSPESEHAIGRKSAMGRRGRLRHRLGTQQREQPSERFAVRGEAVRAADAVHRHTVEPLTQLLGEGVALATAPNRPPLAPRKG